MSERCNVIDAAEPPPQPRKGEEVDHAALRLTGMYIARLSQHEKFDNREHRNGQQGYRSAPPAFHAERKPLARHTWGLAPSSTTEKRRCDCSCTHMVAVLRRCDCEQHPKGAFECEAPRRVELGDRAVQVERRLTSEAVLQHAREVVETYRILRRHQHYAG